MKYAKPAELVRLLLRQSDRHPIRAVGSGDLQPFDPRFVRSLKNLGILNEREDLCDSGETVLQVVDKAMIAVDPDTGACERVDDALDIQMHDINFGAICREIRSQSRLEGPGPSPISPRIWRLGRHFRNARAAEICLARRLRTETAQEFVDHVRGAIDAEAFIAVIGLTRCDLPSAVSRQLDGLRMTVTAVEDHLGNDPAAPFALDLGRIRMASPAVANDTRLAVDRIGRRVILDGIELSIEPRDLGVLVLLAEEAADAGGWVPRDSIAATLVASTDRDGNLEQVDRSMNRLRDAFRKDARLTEVPRSGFIETKPKVGYRLTLPTSEIAFMA